MKNKYENIEIIDLDRDEDIAEIFIADIIDQVGTVGVVSEKEMIEYLLDEALKLDGTSMYYVNMMNDGLHMIYVDTNGYICVVPANILCYFRDVDRAYFDMHVHNGKELQQYIDYCVDEEKNVYLYDVSDEDSDENGMHVSIDRYDSDRCFVATKSNGNTCSSYTYYTNHKLSDDDIISILKEIGF